MEPEVRFKELREWIFNYFRSKISCDITFMTSRYSFMLLCVFDDGFSNIVFDKKKVSSIDVHILARGIHYYSYVDLSSTRLGIKYLSNARKIKTFTDFAPLLEELISKYSVFEFVYENLPTYSDASLIRGFSSFGDVRFSHILVIGDNAIERLIHVFRLDKILRFATYKNDKKIELKEISLKEVPSAFESMVRYMVGIFDIHEYTRLEEAVEELIELIYKKKYDIKDAIKELVEKRGYWDIFGYQF